MTIQFYEERWPQKWLRIGAIALLALHFLSLIGFHDSPWRIGLFIIATFFVSFAYIVNAYRYNRLLWCIKVMTTIVVVQLLSFARIYSTLGLLDDGNQTHDFSTALYFAVITWTTVGYGDVLPVGDARFFAAMQAIIGVLYMGLYVGVISAYLQTSGNLNSDPQKPNSPIDRSGGSRAS